MQCLKKLRPSPGFKKFHFGLECASMVVGSLFVLYPVISLRNHPSLTCISLNLRYAFFSQSWALEQFPGLVELKHLPLLQTLDLDLGRNPLTMDAVSCVAEFSDAPSLRRLRVLLDNCSLGFGSACLLAQLRRNRSLSDLHVDLRCCRVGGGGVPGRIRMAAHRRRRWATPPPPGPPPRPK